MATEKGAQTLLQDRPPKAFMVLGGSLASQRGMKKMAEPFSPFAVAFNSEISFDPPNPLRYAQQGGYMKGNLSLGRDVVFLPDTTGLQGLGLMLDHERQSENGFVVDQNNASQITVIASEPILFRRGLLRGTRDRAAFVANIVRLVASPTVKGINAVTAFPPVGVTDAQLEPFMGKWVQSDPTVTAIDVPRQSMQRERPAEFAGQLEQNDYELQNAAENGTRRDVMKALKKRGKIAKQHVQKIFDGTDTEESTTESGQASTTTMIRTALPLVRRIFKGTAREDIRQLAEQGARVVLVPFQFDRIGAIHGSVSLRDELKRGGIEIEVIELNGFGNAGLALDHLAYADAVKGLVSANGQTH